MALRATKPELKPAKRAKIMVSGDAGVGKTWFSLDFPAVYYMDAEQGADREQYQQKLIDSGGLYFGREQGLTGFSSVIDELKALATEKHSFKTIVIDSFSKLYNDAAADAELRIGSDFGADKKEANKPSRQLIRWIDKVDMNVILICHSKQDWSNKKADGSTGTTYDGYPKLSFELDLWLEIVGKTFIVRKTRIESFREGSTFARNYKDFAERFGQQEISRDTHQLALAKESEIKAAQSLFKGLNYGPDHQDKFFKKCDVESWSEMSSDQIVSLIHFMEGEIDKLKGGK